MRGSLTWVDPGRGIDLLRDREATPKSAPLELPELLKEREKPLHLTWRVFALAGGVVFMILGVVGWLFPIVTGIPFYILGLGLLGMGSRRVRHWINQLEQRLPYRARLFLRPKLRKALRSGGGDEGRGR